MNTEEDEVKCVDNREVTGPLPRSPSMALQSHHWGGDLVREIGEIIVHFRQQA